MDNNKSVPTVDIFGLPISKMNHKETLDYVTSCIARGQSLHIVTNNPVMMMHGLENESFYEVLKQADLHVPDGTGLVWAADVLGDGVQERVAGIDLMFDLLKVGATHGWKVYLLGATAEVVEETAKRIVEQYPGIRVVGYRDGYFSADEDEEIVAHIRDVSPDLLFVARSLEMQEGWIARHRQTLDAKCMMGVGGSFDVIAGKTKRAPKIFQQLRLEWLYRLLKQPTRFTRMLVLPRFIRRVKREKKRMSQS